MNPQYLDSQGSRRKILGFPSSSIMRIVSQKLVLIARDLESSTELKAHECSSIWSVVAPELYSWHGLV